jgi:hypothetical protein
MGFCEQGNELWDAINARNFLAQDPLSALSSLVHRIS